MKSTLRKKMHPALKRDGPFLAVLLFIGLLAYGVMGAWLRFYHDELPILFFHTKMQDIGIFFEGNRPFLEWIYRPLLTILGASKSGWIILSVWSRWLHASCFFWLLRKIWPELEKLWKASALMVMVYPGFQVQFASMIFSITFLIFTCLLASILLSLKAFSSARSPIIFLLLSLALSALSLFTSEYFFLLELVRYPLVWIFLKKEHQTVPARKFLFYCGLHFLLFLVAFAWRMQVQASETTYSIQIIDQLSQSPLPALFSLIRTVVVDMLQTSLGVWGRAVNPAGLLQDQSIRFVLTVTALTIGVSILVFKTLTEGGNRQAPCGENSIPFAAISIAFLMLVLGGAPFWAAGLPVGEEGFFSRWTIPFMLGACVLLPALLNAIFRGNFLKPVLFSALIALGFCVQFLSANSFRHDYHKQNQLYWQLIWRIPGIERDTVFFSDMLDFRYENSDQLSMGINFALSHQSIEESIPLFLYFVPERLGTSILPEIQADQPVLAKRYYSSFSGNTSDAIIIDFQHPACLKILDPEIDLHNPNISPIMKESLRLAHPGRIRMDEIQTIDRGTVNIIGDEPPRGWCYYFEKADLYRQFGRWPDIKELYAEISDQRLAPRDGREWFPFIEGVAHLGDWDLAIEISRSALEKTDNISPALCALWGRIIQNSGSDENLTQINDFLGSELKCK